MSDEARMLAEIHAARGLMRASAPASAIGHAALWAHATRAPSQPVDFSVVRALRVDPDMARRYRAMLGAQALAHAPMAAAASDGAIARRRIGAFDLEILPATDDAPPLLVLRGVETKAPRVIEAWLDVDTVRLDLGAPVEGAIMIALDPAVPEAAELGRMLSDPACAVFLL